MRWTRATPACTGTASPLGPCSVTTLIASIVLYAIGTGPVKGFAITLSIGILTSMFTAILGTRAIINLMYGNKNIKELRV